MAVFVSLPLDEVVVLLVLVKMRHDGLYSKLFRCIRFCIVFVVVFERLLSRIQCAHRCYSAADVSVRFKLRRSGLWGYYVVLV